ncbi:MAG: YIP1 family protein, partial [Thermoanaerobaculia bacterium]
MALESSSWGRVIGALGSPARTFRSIAERPSWWPPLAVLLACGLAVFFLVALRTDFEAVTREALARQGRELDDAKVAQIAGLQRGLGWLFELVASPLLYAGAALVFWVSFKLLGGELDYRQSLGTTLHALLPGALASLLSIPAILGRRAFSLDDLQLGTVLPTSLAALAPPESGLVLR